MTKHEEGLHSIQVFERLVQEKEERIKDLKLQLDRKTINWIKKIDLHPLVIAMPRVHQEKGPHHRGPKEEIKLIFYCILYLFTP